MSHVQPDESYRVKFQSDTNLAPNLEVVVLRYQVHMNFIRTACKFIWINLISFHMKFMRSSFELHVKFIWTSYEFHMNKIDCISYEIHKKFIWTSYEVHTKFTINSYVDHTNFMWSYVHIWFHMDFIWMCPPGPSYKTRQQPPPSPLHPHTHSAIYIYIFI